MIENLSTGIRGIAATLSAKPHRERAEGHAVPWAKPEQRTFAGVDARASAVTIIPAEIFRRMLCQERKRSERSRKNFLLMLVDAKNSSAVNTVQLQRIAGLLGGFIRETDLLGWFETDSSIAVIFNELGAANIHAAIESIEAKALAAAQKLREPDFRISFYAFPDNLRNDFTPDREIYPDLFDVNESKKNSQLVKRAIDLLGSTIALILLSPIIALLALLIKLTSKGPVFFRQERLGQFQVPFVFLKFRTMHVASDAGIHKEYVRNFIAGRVATADGSRKVVYKLTNDPRVTSIGRLMRRTSLDELPQFWNVFRGHMSLVGPRPPIRYEIEAYDVWHRRRLLEAKPGITGLWQVHGRSKTTFDEMVRLDLRYAKTCSLLLDLKILLQTPLAVFSGDGAY